jgi:hypothetical protein
MYCTERFFFFFFFWGEQVNIIVEKITDIQESSPQPIGVPIP